MNERNVSY